MGKRPDFVGPSHILERKPGVHGFSVQPNTGSRGVTSGPPTKATGQQSGAGFLKRTKKKVDKGIDAARAKAGLGLDLDKTFNRLKALQGSGRRGARSRHVSAAELEAQRAAARLRTKAGF
jgi:hypothetical protein